MRKFRFFSLFVLLFAMSLAFAWAKEPLPAAWDELVNQGVVMIMNFLGTILFGVAIWAVNKFRQKTGIQIEYAQTEKSREELRRIILSMEEKFLSKYVGDATKRGAAKLVKVLEEAGKRIPWIPADTVKQWIHEELPRLGLGALGKKNGGKPVDVDAVADPIVPIPDPQ